MKICYFCKKEVEIIKPVRNDTCKNCGAYLKVCLNCKLFNEKSSRCDEPQAEVVRDKEKANFCEYFYFSDKNYSNNEQKDLNLSKKFHDLFK